MDYLRKAKTRGGNEVRIFLDTSDYCIGVYWTDGPRYTGWVPVKWPKLTPFINGTKESGLDLIEDIRIIKI